MAIAAANNVLVTLDEMKSFLEIPTGNTSFDDKVQILINACSESIANYCKRILVTNSNVEYRDGRRNSILTLREFPINSVSEVAIDITSKFSGDETVVDADQYQIDNSKTALVFRSVLQNGQRNIRVTYSSGYGTAAGDDLPWDLRYACMEYVKWLYKSDADDRVGTTSKGKAGETTSYIQNIPDHVQQLLSMYVNHQFLTDAGTYNG